MQTLFLGEEQVRAYLFDLQTRIQSLASDAPTVWVPLGYSGLRLLEVLFKIEGGLGNTEPTVLPADCLREPGSQEVRMLWGKDNLPEVPKETFAGKNVMVIDSAVHSGSTMATAVRKIWEAGATGVCSYSLVLKESSRFIPNFWAVSIADEDRAFFLLSSIPNNRFVPLRSFDEGSVAEEPFANALIEAKARRLPYFSLRKLSRDDIDQKKFDVGVESLNRSTWADLYYVTRNSHDCLTYVVEASGKIVGYITIDLPDARELSIEQVAVDPGQAKRGYGGALLRWAETLARLKDCDHIRLWAISDQADWYQQNGFKRTHDEVLDLGAEKYVRMRKCLLGHTGCCNHVAATQVQPTPAVL